MLGSNDNRQNSKFEVNNLTEALVVKAVESLYSDRIRPLLPDLLQRVKYFIKDATAVNKKAIKLDVNVLSSFIKSQCDLSVRLISYNGNNNFGHNENGKRGKKTFHFAFALSHSYKFCLFLCYLNLCCSN